MPNSTDQAALGALLSYRVVTAGPRDGHTHEHVSARLAALFRRTEEQMRALLAAPRAIIKKQIDFADAQRFKAALEDCGCVCVVEPESPDFSTLLLSRYASGGTGVIINAPEAWHASTDGHTFQLLDEASGAQFTAVGIANSGHTVQEWTEQRLRTVEEDMPYMRQVRGPYALKGADWGARVQGIAAEYRGILPGTNEYSHYLVLSLRTELSLVCLTLGARAAAFDANEALYRWLLENQLDVHDARQTPAQDEALQRWLKYNAATDKRGR
ncbi:hypothetical protein [Pseudoduganella namucuonensis]|uniref:Uncharacterized protein n=1 Tax=Pseudoduganella namucuonensis TaxID=1035707 RepID=A0A1I7KWP5_9BURK|nr:hypothetical protein [Pseudoduganella namucuonensis]SFV01855.1 hypothetical protein SAMN05216552_102092 [Pseudoduganella namucuonensis]